MTVKLTPEAEAFLRPLNSEKENERVARAIRARYQFACQNIAFLVRVPEKTDVENDIRQEAAMEVVADTFEVSIETVKADVAKFSSGER